MDILSLDIFDVLDEQFCQINSLFESIDNIDPEFIMNEDVGSKIVKVGGMVKDTVKTIIRKIKAIIGQLSALIKKVSGKDKIPNDGTFIHIEAANRLLDRLIANGDNVDDINIPVKNYKADEKINPIRLQSIINKCNKYIQMAERNQNSDQNAIQKLNCVNSILNHSMKLTKALMYAGSADTTKTIEEFKKEYKYRDSDHTIDFNGTRIMCVIGNDMGHIGKNLANGLKLHGTCAFRDPSTKQTGIRLSERFFMIPDANKRRAVLAHEIGHLKTSKGNDYYSITNDEIDSQNREKYGKYVSKKSIGTKHLDEDELVADRYAANMSSKKDLINALDWLRRKNKNNARTPTQLYNTYIVDKRENKIRRKALNDRSINRSIYK